ncbi:MAG: HAD family hydrolase [Firmicutes bacterium]|nr:HAD family hydrolase [Bacillota bacterium]
MKKGIIFDMDGTLWDTTPLLLEVWNRVMQGYEETKGKFLSLEEIRGLMGKTMYEIGEAVMPGVETERQEEIFNGCIDAEDEALIQQGGSLYPGLEDTLKLLQKNYHLYIVSNGQENYAHNFIEFYHFEKYFEDEETFGRTLKSKAENIKLLVERNGLDEAVYVGDTRQDETSAEEAGVKFIYASYGFGEALKPDETIGGLGELPRALERIGF